MMMSFVIIILIFFLAFISEFLGEKIQIISGIHRVRASHWSKLKKLYLASWLMNTSPLELLDSAFVWLRGIVKSKWISRISIKQKWVLIYIFIGYCSLPIVYIVHCAFGRLEQGSAKEGRNESVPVSSNYPPTYPTPQRSNPGSIPPKSSSITCLSENLPRSLCSSAKRIPKLWKIY